MRFIFILSLLAFPLLHPCLLEAQTSLAEDARVAVVTDRQGTALVRPVGRERWTPVGPRTVLLPGDQVCTPLRGANAVEMRLKGGGGLVLGPGSLIEIPAAGAVRLYRGDLEVKGGGKRSVAVTGPGEFRQDVKETTVLRTLGRTTEVLSDPPRWLTGYRASTTDEWMGSLIARVDGRDVPLSVGYHKVTAEICDQIARTTIEQSFRNATDATLEGVFYFPLPPDASISGFGMWIGGELVEADIVEKQKARRIYEDILRRKKDPGLLEWSGGNLFKARVFPILPHSEKRIRIRYTQVLPLEGATLRYRYGLRSELLRTRPLRELGIHVIVSSAMPIRSVTSATHEVRVRKTAHAASAEFSAGEYSPDRDFELAVELDRSQPLTVVPHRRGDDGYFMLLLNPPGEGNGAWQRDLLPEAGALEVLLIADTSGSMDPAARKAQAAFLGALLAQLGPNDRFRLMTADVGVHWFRKEAVAAGEEAVGAALAFLEGRRSLGWSDLDLAFKEALNKAGPRTQVVYVGDGIGTTGDADPVALATRLKNLASETQATCHAVSVSSTFERGVLEAMAAVGGGSVRSTGEDPAGVAFRLLKEAATPAIRNLKVSFQDIRTARVYPEVLPNLAANTQQVVLGRFLPTGDRQAGKVVVTGMRDGKAVQFSADLVLEEGEAGNSFLPRLWARRHIDALLQEGRSKAVQEEIVRFSEAFGIMTPFTSFLVLENDADRERYGVERRVKMRDGERFFAKGRDAASTALLREQMKVARTWRLNLRKRMLREIATLGAHLVPATVAWGKVRDYDVEIAQGAYLFGAQAQSDSSEFFFGADRAATRHAGFKSDKGKKAGDWSGDSLRAPEEAGDELLDDGEEDLGEEELEIEEKSRKREDRFDPAAPEPEASLEEPLARRSLSRKAVHEARGGVRYDEALGLGGGAGGYFRGRPRGGMRRRPAPPSFNEWRFPGLPPAPKPVPDLTDPPKWPATVLALLKSLNRRDRLAALKAGIEVEQKGGAVHPPTGRRIEFSRAHGLYGAAGWFLRTGGGVTEPMDQWVAGGKRGVLSAALRLGRLRDAETTDRMGWRFPLSDHSLTDLVRTYRKWSAKVEKRAGDVAVVVLTAPGLGKTRIRFTLDIQKQVVVEEAVINQGRVTRSTRYFDFVEAGGMWWATRIEYLDDKSRATSRFRLEVKALEAEAFAAALSRAVSGHEDVIFLGSKDTDLTRAKQAVHEKKGTFADHFRMAAHYAASGQWDRAWTAWDQAASRVSGKPGTQWLSAALMKRSRRGEDLKKMLHRLARECADPRGHDFTTDFRTDHIFSLAHPVFQVNENLTLLEVLRPAFERKGEDRDWLTTRFERKRAQWLKQAGLSDEAREIYKKIAAARPFDIRAVLDHANALRDSGHLEEAVRILEAKLETMDKWIEYETDQLTERFTTLLWERRDLKKLSVVLEAWITRSSRQETPYRRYLSVLLFRDRLEAADAWADAQLKAEIVPPVTPEFRARLGAAINYALGHGWNFHYNRIEERWLTPLADLARRLLRADDPVWNHVNRITSDWRFRRSDAYAELRKHLLADLDAPEAIETMDLGRLGHYLNQLPWGLNQVDAKVWRRTVDRLRARWQRSTVIHERQTLAAHVLKLLDNHGEKAEAVGFLRARLAAAGDDTRPGLAGLLLQRLLGLKWTRAVEDEIIDLVAQLQPKKAEESTRRFVAAAAVRRIADGLYRMRYKHLLGDAKEHEKLSRKALKVKKRQSADGARAGLVDRFAAARDASKWGKVWYEVERIGFKARLRRDLRAADAEAREVFFATPVRSNEPLDAVLRERCAYVMAYCATRRKAPEGLADAAVKLLANLVAEASPEKGEKAPVRATDWRTHLFRILVALDRPEALRGVLEAWIVPAKVESRWRIALGYLRAETGHLEEAAAAFQAVARMDELASAEHKALADWYLVLNREAEREKALLDRYKVMPEHQLSSKLHASARRISRRGGGVPESLDPDTLRVMRALLSKASHPANYIWQINRHYLAVKDFRILECLADGVIGHTASGVYPFLERVGQIIRNVHEEATCDELVERIGVLTEAAQNDLDRRALELLVSLVERRAAEVLNQPGPHADRGLTAMRAAFKGSWGKGERRLMAKFLASLGRIPQPPYAAEQLRQLRGLLRQETPGSADRLAIARNLFSTEWTYRRFDVAIDGLSSALEEYRKAHGGAVPNPARDGLGTLIGWLEHRMRFARAEAILVPELEAQKIRSHRNWLRQRLFQVYVNCLGQGTVSLGKGLELYRAARQRMEASMWRDGPDQIRNTLAKFCSLHGRAKKQAGIRSAGPDLMRFAGDKLPELITLAHTGGSRLVNTVASEVKRLLGPRAGLRVLLDRIEDEPRWYARVGQGGWSQYAWSLAMWRSEARDLGDLEPRLLRVVLQEIERDLLSLQSRNRSIYHSHNKYFWAAKKEEFADVASRVIELNPDSPARLQYAAKYLWDGLRLRRRAIGVLQEAESRGQLREEGRHVLVIWLFHVRRYAESLPLLEKLTAARSDRLEYRTLMIRALHETGRDPAARACLEETKKRFKALKLWNENTVASLAETARLCKFHEESVVLYEEVIPLHQRTHRNRGVGGGALSSYYGRMAQAYAALGKADKAVDAASAAVVAWGRTSRNRHQALRALRRVVETIGDLDGYVVRMDGKVKKTGLDAPVIRKTLGLVYLARKLPLKAIVQLEIARALQPNDDETHKALVRAYDAAGDGRGACAALFASIALAPMNLDLYPDLGRRLKALGQANTAERAWTTLVEVKPNEAAGHRKLAEHRSGQKRFEDAVVQWQQVVRCRAEEPDGWLRLARAQIRAGNPEGARGTVDHLLETKWEKRFGDVKVKAAKLLEDCNR